MSLQIKMDDWNRLCDFFGLVHGSDIDLMLQNLDDKDTPAKAEERIQQLENDLELEEDKVDDLKLDITILKRENEELKLKLKEFTNAS